MCPFKTSSCGSTSEYTFEKSGESKSLSLTLYPGDVCFYAIRAECGVPSFEPSSTEDVAIYTIEYDDDEITSDDTGSSSSGIPLPGKTSLTSDDDPYNSYEDDYYYGDEDMWMMPPCDNSTENCTGPPDGMPPPCDNSTGNCTFGGFGNFGQMGFNGGQG
jgi:hypothetical protein